MKWTIWAGAAWIFLSSLAGLSTAAPSLKVIVPDNDLWNYPFSRIRIAGNTQPGNRVTVNGREVQVYPTGAFVDRVSLEEGNNTIVIVAQDSTGVATISRTVRRSEAPATLSSRHLTISDEEMMPADDLDVLPGDLVRVRFKGTPGGKASFSLGGGLRDLPMTETALDGVGGFYTGVCRIREGDCFSKERIEFALEVKGLGRTEKKARATLMVEPRLWPRVAVMEDPNPYLLAGTGGARLGGAQLGNLSPGTMLELAGRIGDLYRVRLSSTRSAWVPVKAVRLLPAGTHPPRSLVGSSTLQGNEIEDEFLLSLEQRIPYLLESSVDPPGLMLHLFGAASNLTWMTRHLSATTIKRVSWEQESEDHLKFRLELGQSPVWGYGAEYEEGSNRLKVFVRRPPCFSDSQRKPLAGLVVAVDPGHGGSNQGALGALGIQEKRINLETARVLKEKLELAGAKVILSRETDKYEENVQRPLRAIRAGANLFLSLHCNSIGLSGDPLAARGVSVYTRYEAFQPLAQCFYSRLVEMGLEEYGMVGSFNSSVVKFSHIPSILVELAFLSHPEDEANLIDPEFRSRAADAMVQGLLDFLQVERDGELLAQPGNPRKGG